jgi:hypothetical protein
MALILFCASTRYRSFIWLFWDEALPLGGPFSGGLFVAAGRAALPGYLDAMSKFTLVRPRSPLRHDALVRRGKELAWH